MAINAYTGLQGSGKSFEVVSTVILGAVLKGRDVVTNIEGVDEEKIHTYLKNQKTYKGQTLGKIVHCTNARVEEEKFFPVTNDDAEALVRPGNLVCIDEAWRFWSTKAPTKEHMTFFREHRHFVHPTSGVSCDLVIMVQDVTDIHKSLKNVIEMCCVTTKLKRVGLSTRYRIDVFEGSRLYKTRLISSYQKKYDREMFPLYSSYGGKGGNETQVDSRQNMFRPSFLVFGLLAFAMIGFGSWYVVGFFNPDRVLNKTAKPDQLNSQPTPQTQEISRQIEVNPATPSGSGYYVGDVVVGGNFFSIVQLDDGRVVYLPSSFKSGNSPFEVIQYEGATYVQKIHPPASAPAAASL